MNDIKFFLCKHCGNLVRVIHDSGAPMTCCGDHMTLLEANTVEASHEKHIPVVSIDENKVTVNIGSVDHPMTEAHYIQWIYLQTTSGGQLRCLNPGEAPNATFYISDEEPLVVYEYCNLHGLWKKEL